MGKPYSEDLRRSVVEAIESGMTYEEVADSCGVSISSVSRFLTRWRRTGSVSAEKFGGYKGYALEPYSIELVAVIGFAPESVGAKEGADSDNEQTSQALKVLC